MYRVIKSRGTGKTRELMMDALAIRKEIGAPVVILCSNPRAMERKAYSYGVVGVDFKGYDEFHSIGEDTIYYIDELENFVKYYFSENGKLRGYSLTNED